MMSEFGIRYCRASLICIVFLFGNNVHACLWTYGTDVHGTPRILSDSMSRLFSADASQSRDDWLKQMLLIETKLPKGDYRDRNDFAVALIHLGRVDEAIEIFKQIEAEQPGLYQSAANLGTAFELRGDLQSALDWIKLGIVRNPQAHDGTEWLHVMILEAKISLASDPHWLKTHSVLGLDFNRDIKPTLQVDKIVDSENRSYSLLLIRRALDFQLAERVPLTPSPNAVVGSLLEDLGNVLALEDSLEKAIPAYQLALQYGPRDEQLVRQRLEHFQTQVRRNILSGQSPFVVLFFGILVGVIGFIVGLRFIVRWLRRRSAALSPDK